MGILVDGCVLLVLGQGAVFLFLGLMIGLTVLLARLSRGIQPGAAASGPVPEGSQAPEVGDAPQTEPEGDVAAVIAAAVHRFRGGRR